MSDAFFIGGIATLRVLAVEESRMVVDDEMSTLDDVEARSASFNSSNHLTQQRH